MTRSFASLLAATLLLTGLLAGCECDPPPDMPDGAVDAGPLPDGFVPDAGMTDGGPPPPNGPVITICPGDSLPPLATGICETTAGDGNILITGDVLTPGEVFRGGQVLVGDDGTISCVGCDCSGEAGASGATTVVCPDGVVSPGLINGHDHVGFTTGPPSDATLERYEHRNEWRRGINGHNSISNGGQTGGDLQLWEELRETMAGTTAGITEGGRDGFVRNLDGENEGLAAPRVTSETFILGDLDNPTPMATGCGYAELPLASDIAGDDAFVPHLAEGVAASARNEFECSRAGENDIIQSNTAIIHGVGLLAADIAELAADRTSLIWSPRTNISLYGDTARVTLYDNQGVLIAIGTDWMRSGSMNMLRELRCADDLNRDYFDGYFTDEQLWLMATRNGAVVSSVEEFIGTLAPGMIADISIFDGSEQGDHRAVLEAGANDVALVLRSGRVLYGETATVDALETGCDAIDVCGSSRSACVMREIGRTYADLAAANASTYELFFCDEDPRDEPTCIPSRNAEAPLPSPEVNGSNRYDGMLSADDSDGDGIPNASDICPSIFNPIRPLDDGEQADADGDGLGDECDPCPLDADTTECTALNPNDRDNDMVDDTVDNCPTQPNMDQADGDGDGIGDVCDLCPDDPNPPGTSCPGTIYQVKDGTFGSGAAVRLLGSVVTGVDTRGFSMQMPTDHASFTTVDNSGIYVFTGTAPALDDATPVTVGMTVDVDGSVNIFRDQIQMSPTSVAMSAAAGAAITPTVATPADVAMGGAREDALESVLVTVEGVGVAAISEADGEFTVDDGLLVDDLFFLIEPFVAVAENFVSITGVLMHRGDTSKLHPRSIDDYVAGAPQIDSFGPAMVYARANTPSGPTFPAPLTVRLTRPAPSPTTITFTSDVPNLAIADVIIDTGMSEAVVPVDATTTSAGSGTITADLGGDMTTAMIRVLGAAEAPQTFTLTPATATIASEGMATFVATLEFPAPAAGATITLSEDTGGTIPPTLMFAQNEQVAMFDYLAPVGPVTGTLTATLLGPGAMQTAALDVAGPQPGTLVINEVDYNQTDTDAAEYIELYNPGTTAIQLAGIQLHLINQTGTPYGPTPLDLASGTATQVPPGGYLLIAVAAVTSQGAPTVALSPATNALQNGPSDGFFIYDSTNMVVLDAFGYDGSTTFTINGTLVTMASTRRDATSGDVSISRVPDGAMGATDDVFVNTMCLTPGGPNIDSATSSCP